MKEIAKKRNAALAAGILTYICLGFFFSWSNYIDFMERAQGWSRTELAGVFTANVLIAVVLMYLGLKFSILWLLILAVSLIGLGYGAAATTNPVFVRRFYGEKNYAQNLGIVNCNGLFSAFLGSTMGPFLIEHYAGYDAVMLYFIGLIAIAFVLQLGIKRP